MDELVLMNRVFWKRQLLGGEGVAQWFKLADIWSTKEMILQKLTLSKTEPHKIPIFS